MSFISDLLGGQKATPGSYQANEQQFNQTMANQNANINALQTQAAGGGPSVAEAMLKNAQNATAANANALAAGARGNNPGMALRQAMQSNAQGGQQAAAQAVVGRQQEQLNAQQLLGGAINTQMGQIVQGSQANADRTAQVQNANAGRSQSAAGGAIGAIGGLMGLADGGEIPSSPGLNLSADVAKSPFGDLGKKKQGGGGEEGGGGGGGGGIGKLAMLLAEGSGYIPSSSSLNLSSDVAASPFGDLGKKKKKGGEDSKQPEAPYSAGPVVAAGNATSGPAVVGLPTAAPWDKPAQYSGAQFGPQTLAQAGPQSMAGKLLAGIGSMGQKVGQAGMTIGKGIIAQPQAMANDAQTLASMFASGGQAKPRDMKNGGHVPGKAKVPGPVNSYKNDVVPAVLSPKEIVLPRSVTLADNAPEKAAAFVRAIQARKGKK